jgi:uncharacterized protein YkwD
MPHLRLLLILAALLAGCSPAHIPQPVSPLHYAYVPLAITAPTATAPACYRSAPAVAFAQMLATDARQQRTVVRCHPALVAAAQQRAESMAALRYFGHCDPNGVCPNPVARAAGCRLPAAYTINGNNIESILAGTPDPALTWQLLSASPGHARHLLGLDAFFREQHDIGVAFVAAPGSEYSFYWVILIAVCEVPTSGE